PRTRIVVANVSQAKKDKLRADIHATNILLQGSELTKDDRESQLYDEFEHYTRVKTFMTSTLGGLKESNHDQLYAYLKQHELHANENKMLMERLNQHSHDPLALVSNVSPYQYPSSSSVPLQPSYISPGGQNRVQGNNARGAAAAENGVDLDEEQLLFLVGGQTNTFDDGVDEGPVQDMAQNEDNIFQAN
ncbi:hypothetical protein Tco_1475081, partial [Tanacetum coccineum]